MSFESFSDFFNRLIRSIRNLLGFSSVKPGDKVSLDGVGDRYSGDAEVEATSHALDDSADKQQPDTERPGGFER